MTTLRTAFATLAGPAVLALATPAASQMQDLPNTGDNWTHEATGTILPAQAGAFSRVSLRTYDDAGHDASAGYRMVNEDGMLIVSVYIYPGHKDFGCREVFEASRGHITNYEGERLLSEGGRESLLGNCAETHFARYLIPAGGVKANLPELVSDLYLTCPEGNEWMVKYRASWTGSEETFPSLDPLFDRIAWPVSLTGG